jgi:hypothetical protein
VRHEDGTARELQEGREDGLDGELFADEEIVDPRELGDERGDGLLGVDQGLERADALAARDEDGPDLRDPRIPGGSARGLEVDDHERDVS